MSCVASVTILLGVAMMTQRPYVAIMTAHGYVGIIIVSVLFMQTAVGFITLFLKRQPLSKPGPAVATNSVSITSTAATAATIQQQAIAAKPRRASAKPFTINNKSIRLLKSNPNSLKIQLLRTVSILGSQTISATIHKYLGLSLMFASLTNLILGMNLLYTDDNRYEILLGCWYGILGVIFFYLEETRVHRWLKCCYPKQTGGEYRSVYAYAGDMADLYGYDTAIAGGGAVASGSPVSPATAGEASPLRREPSIANETEPTSHVGDISIVPAVSTPPQEDSEMMTRAELKQLLESGRRLVVMNSCVYDVEDFEDMHPGGMVVIGSVIGMDITEFFLLGNYTASGHSHVHSAVARSILQDYFIAKLQVVEQDTDSKAIHIRTYQPAVSSGRIVTPGGGTPYRSHLQPIQMQGSATPTRMGIGRTSGLTTREHSVVRSGHETPQLDQQQEQQQSHQLQGVGRIGTRAGSELGMFPSGSSHESEVGADSGLGSMRSIAVIGVGEDEGDKLTASR